MSKIKKKSKAENTRFFFFFFFFVSDFRLILEESFLKISLNDPYMIDGGQAVN